MNTNYQSNLLKWQHILSPPVFLPTSGMIVTGFYFFVPTLAFIATSCDFFLPTREIIRPPPGLTLLISAYITKNGHRWSFNREDV